MRSAYSPIRSSPQKLEIPLTKCSEVQSRYDSQTWSDVKKGIREKVYSRVQGFENQKFIQKSDLLYNFKSKDGLPLTLRSTASHLKNQLDNKFPRQESPIKLGLTHSLYSPSQKQYDVKVSNAYPTSFGSFTEKEKSKVYSSKSSSDIKDFTKRTKPINERVTLTDIIRISNHLQDLQQSDTSSLSSGYLQELLGLQQNINKVLKYTNSKLYK